MKTKSAAVLVLTLVASLVVASMCVGAEQDVRVEIVDASGAASKGAQHARSTRVFRVSSKLQSLIWSDAQHVVVVVDAGPVTQTPRPRAIEFSIDDGTTRVLARYPSALSAGLARGRDGKRFFAAHWRSGAQRASQLLEFDVARGQQARVIDGIVPEASGIRFSSDPVVLRASPCGRYLAGGSKLVDDGMLPGAHVGGATFVCDLVRGAALWENRTTHTDVVRALAFTSDGETVISAGEDMLIRVWRSGSGELLRSFVGAAWDGILDLDLSPNGKVLASGGFGRDDGGMLRLWDFASGRMLRHERVGSPRSGLRLRFGPDGRLFVLAATRAGQAASDRQAKPEHAAEAGFVVEVFDARELRRVGTLGRGSGHARGLALSPNGAKLAVATYDGLVTIFEL